MTMVLQGSYFLASLDYFKGTKHVNMITGKRSTLNSAQFITNLNNYLKHGLLNAINYVRISLV